MVVTVLTLSLVAAVAWAGIFFAESSARQSIYLLFDKHRTILMSESVRHFSNNGSWCNAARYVDGGSIKIRDLLGMSMRRCHISGESTSTTHAIVLRVMHSALSGTTIHCSRSTTKPILNILLLNNCHHDPARSRNQKLIANPRITLTSLWPFYFWADYGELPFSIRYLLQRDKWAFARHLTIGECLQNDVGIAEVSD